MVSQSPSLSWSVFSIKATNNAKTGVQFYFGLQFQSTMGWAMSIEEAQWVMGEGYSRAPAMVME